MSDCRRLLRASISNAQKIYGKLTTSNARFFEGLMRETNRDLQCYAFIPLPIFCIISTLTIIPITTRLFTLPLSIEATDRYHSRNDKYTMKKSEYTLFRVRHRITDFAIYFINRPIKLNRISLIDKYFTLTNNGDKSSHKIVSHTGKQWINKNNQQWIKIYAHLGIYLYIKI